MKKYIIFTFCSAVMLLCMKTYAYANIAPLKVTSDGVEPLMNPGVKIQSADITVKPEKNGFIFTCNYALKSMADGDALTVGVPGDLGYTLEAGYIENLSILVNGKAAEFKTYNTTSHLSDVWKSYPSPLNFKWHTFEIPVKKDEVVDIKMTYNISWRILEQSKNSPYYIVPFLLSTDKLFGDSIGTYRVKYINDDYISIPDVKVMMNSMLDPNIVSQAILSPKWSDSEISWEFKNTREFQDFRLIVLSFRKLAMEFSTDTNIDHSIRWSMINDDFNELAAIFEDIVLKDKITGLTDEDLGTAAYLASEFYFRLGNYDKSLEMLTLPYQTVLWPASIKQEYINAVNLKKAKKYSPLLNELNKLSQYKDYILVSNYAINEIGPVTKIVDMEIAEKNAAEEKAAQEKAAQEKAAQERQNAEKKNIELKKRMLQYALIPLVIIAILELLYIIYKKRYNKKQR